MATATGRLQREYKNLQKEPVPHIIARPSSNILDWHYIIVGPAGTPYEGGEYHGLLRFSPEYPMKPPGITMVTPSGRFETNRRLCLSMSDFHPETWNPMWSVGSILTGLLSFMLDDAETTGSIRTTLEEKRKLAAQSRAFNRKDKSFTAIFSDLPEDYKVLTEAPPPKTPPPSPASPPSSPSLPTPAPPATKLAPALGPSASAPASSTPAPAKGKGEAALPETAPSGAPPKVCSLCKGSFGKDGYSKAQWAKPADSRRCKTCVETAPAP